MKKFENLGRKLSKGEKKLISGGVSDEGGCLSLGADCNDDVQCCTNNCAFSSGSMRKGCQISTIDS